MPGRAGAAIAVALVVGLGACGGGGGSSAALNVRAAAAATTTAGSARVHTRMSGLENDEEKADAAPVTLDSTTLVDFASGDSSMTYKVHVGDDPITPAAEVRMVGGVAYMRFRGGLHVAPMPPERASGPEGPGPAAP